MRAALAGLALITGACVMVANDRPPRPGGVSPGGRCNAAAARALVGRPASSQLAADARRRSGAETVRWLRPGQIVTMEYREGRLNLKLDPNNRVQAITCG